MSTCLQASPRRSKSRWNDLKGLSRSRICRISSKTSSWPANERMSPKNLSSTAMSASGRAARDASRKAGSSAKSLSVRTSTHPRPWISSGALCFIGRIRAGFLMKTAGSIGGKRSGVPWNTTAVSFRRLQTKRKNCSTTSLTSSSFSPVAHSGSARPMYPNTTR